MGKKQSSKWQILFGFNFRFSLERCVTKTPSRQRLRCVSCFINEQNESVEFLSFIFLVSLPCCLRKQRLRRFNSKDLTSDERKIEKEVIIYSDYKGEQIAFNQNEMQLDVYGYWVTIAVDEENGSLWDNSSRILNKIQHSCYTIKFRYKFIPPL